MPALEHEILSEIELILVGMASCVLPSKFLLFLLALFGSILKGIFAQIPIRVASLSLHFFLHTTSHKQQSLLEISTWQGTIDGRYTRLLWSAAKSFFCVKVKEKNTDSIKFQPSLLLHLKIKESREKVANWKRRRRVVEIDVVARARRDDEIWSINDGEVDVVKSERQRRHAELEDFHCKEAHQTWADIKFKLNRESFPFYARQSFVWPFSSGWVCGG